MVGMENNQMTSTIDVAHTIVEQLGGSKFIVMTGARRFVGSPTGITFALPGTGGFTKHSINRVRIELTPADTYTVTFFRVHGIRIVTVSQHEDVYFDMLQGLFTRETGLAVSL